MSNGMNGQQPSTQDVLTGELSDEILGMFDDDEVNKIKEQNEKMAQEQRELAKAYAAVFSSQKGKKVIEDLLDRTLRESVYMPERDNAEMLGHIREGQNSIVRYLSQRIQQGKEAHQQDKGDE